MRERIDYEIIDGKPYLGREFGQYMRISSRASWAHPDKDPILVHSKKLLEDWISRFAKNSPEFEVRYYEIITRLPSYADYFAGGTMGHKYVVWGRAFKVMRLGQGHTRRKKKMWFNGRRVRR